MKILFINIQLRPDSVRRQLPVGLAYVMTATKKAGYDFDLYDTDINNYSIDDLKEFLSENIYDVYAFGCIVTGYNKVKKIAAAVRESYPWARIVVGNSIASSIPDILLNTTEVDYAIIGEGEETFLEFLDKINRPDELHRIPNLGICNGRGSVPCGWVNDFSGRDVIADLDTIGFPDWDIFDLDKYESYGKININEFSNDQDIVSYPLNSARGCPHNCGFCYHVFKDDIYRRYSIGVVIDEIRRLHYDYGCNYVHFWDELTFPNVVSAKTFAEEMSSLPFEIRWAANTRIGVFNKKDSGLLKDLFDLGCTTLGGSLESASPKILRAMNKKIKVKNFVEQIETIYKSGIIPISSLIFGYPQETKETIKLTLDTCERANIYPSSGFLLPMPGTEVYDWAVRFGYITDEVKYLEHIGDRQDMHINLTAMEDKEFYDAVKEGLERLADKLDIEVDDVFKTIKRKKPGDRKC